MYGVKFKQDTIQIQEGTKTELEENEAFYYTHTSIKMDASTSKIREEIVEYASQFIGNPYVWGGTCLLYTSRCV